MRKKLLPRLLAALVILGVSAALAQYCYMQKTYIKIDGAQYARNITELDLRGKTVTELEKIRELSELKTLDLRDTGLSAQQYQNLRDALPQCCILWSVPFQGQYMDMDTVELAVQQLTESGLDEIALLNKLAAVDATECEDLDMVLRLQEMYPHLKVTYTVPLGQNRYRENTKELVLENANPDEVEAALTVLPELTKVTFTGTAPDNDRIYEWVCSYPQIQFLWTFQVCGVDATSVDTQLILNDIPMDSVEEVESSLKYFYDLQWVEMCNCGIPSEDMDALWKRHPETRFVWMVDVGVCRLRTDIQSFMPYHFGYDGYSVLYDQDMGEMKYCVDIICMDMGHMGISDYSFLSYMPHMQYLILADTMGTDFSVLAELKELKFLEIFMTNFDQAEVLVGLTSLEDLNIGTSRIDNIEPLLEMTWLQRLWLPGNVNISYAERKQLVDGLPDTIVMFATNSSTGGGWRESPNYYAMRDLLGMAYFKN